MDFLQPPGWARPRGYSNGVVSTGQTIHVSGMLGWDSQGYFHHADFAGQVRQALDAIVPRSEGARAECIRRMRKGEDTSAVLRAIRAVYSCHGNVTAAHLAAVPGMPSMPSASGWPAGITVKPISVITTGMR